MLPIDLLSQNPKPRNARILEQYQLDPKTCITSFSLPPHAPAVGKQTFAVEGSGGLPHRGAGSPAGRSAAAATAAAGFAGPAGPTSPAGDPADAGPASHPATPAAARLVCSVVLENQLMSVNVIYELPKVMQQ